MKFSEKELDDIAHHLQVAAGRYGDHAASVALPQVADRFRAQAKDAMALAERIQRREDDEELLTIEEAADYTAGRKPRRIKCTDSLGNVAYLYPSGATWRCVLACGTPAAFSYAIGPFASEAEIRFKLEDAASDEERLATLRKAHERCPNYRAELV